MSSLNSFPINVLDSITTKLVTAEQLSLWQCGDRNLNSKLKNGGLTSTTLCWSSTSWMPWPYSFFAIFTGLEAVNWTADTRKSLCPSMDVSVLPEALDRLQLDFDDVFILLRQHQVNLNDLFPSLRVLKLKGNRLNEDNLKHLPQRLVELRVYSGNGSRRSKRIPTIRSKVLFRDLPTTLEHLDFGFAVADLEQVGNDLPSGLQSLHLWSIQAPFDWFSKLPKSLTKLVIMFLDFFNWRLLPPNLEELEIGPLPQPSSILPLLPSALKSLRCSIDPYLTDNDIELLPKTLTRADIFPQQITHVGLQRLPTTLTDTTFCVQATHPDILSFFHAETTKISLLTTSISSNLNLFRLPPKLSSLTVDCINDDICALVPPCVTYLRFDGGFISSKGASKLPKSIKYLHVEVGVFDEGETMSYFGQIPHIRLSYKSETSLLKVNENWLSFLNSKPGDESNEVGWGLSGSVNILELEIRQSTSPLTLEESAFECFAHFTHLSILHIGMSSGAFLPASYIQCVPKSLTDLVLGMLNDFPSASDLSTLPKCLRYLELGVDTKVACPWKDEDLGALPRSLQIFGLRCGSFSKLTDNSAQFLPPYLMELTVNYDAAAGFTTPLESWYFPSEPDPQMSCCNIL